MGDLLFNSQGLFFCFQGANNSSIVLLLNSFNCQPNTWLLILNRIESATVVSPDNIYDFRFWTISYTCFHVCVKWIVISQYLISQYLMIVYVTTCHYLWYYDIITIISFIIYDMIYAMIHTIPWSEIMCQTMQGSWISHGLIWSYHVVMKSYMMQCALQWHAFFICWTVKYDQSLYTIPSNSGQTLKSRL